MVGVLYDALPTRKSKMLAFLAEAVTPLDKASSSPKPAPIAQ